MILGWLLSFTPLPELTRPTTRVLLLLTLALRLVGSSLIRLAFQQASLQKGIRAGDSIEDLVEDYDCPPLFVEEAIRCEMPAAA